MVGTNRVRPEPEYPAGTRAGAKVPAPVSWRPDMNFEIQFWLAGARFLYY